MTTATTVRYVARYRSLRLVMKPSYSKEVDGRSIPVSGTAIQFEDNQYSTSDPAEIEFLDSRPELKTGLIVRVEGIADSSAVLAEMNKTLEDKDAEIARLKKERDDALAKRGAAIDTASVTVPDATGASQDDDAAEVGKYDTLEVKDLVAECKARDLPANKNDGKAKLIAKLEAYDKLNAPEVPADEEETEDGDEVAGSESTEPKY